VLWQGESNVKIREISTHTHTHTKKKCQDSFLLKKSSRDFEYLVILNW